MTPRRDGFVANEVPVVGVVVVGFLSTTGFCPCCCCCCCALTFFNAAVTIAGVRFVVASGVGVGCGVAWSFVTCLVDAGVVVVAVVAAVAAVTGTVVVDATIVGIIVTVGFLVALVVMVVLSLERTTTGFVRPSFVFFSAGFAATFVVIVGAPVG